MSTHVIRLYPFAWDDASRTRNGTLLAAQGQGQSEEITSVTLSSHDNEIFLKAIKDIHSGETWLYLLADNAEKYRGGLIKPFGMEKEYVVDAGDRVNIDRVEWPVPDSLSAEIQFPDATYTLDPVDFETGRKEPLIFETSYGDRIELSIDETSHNVCHFELRILKTNRPEKQKPLKIAVKTSENIELSHIRPIVGDSVSFDTPLSAGKIDIYLYGERTGG